MEDVSSYANELIWISSAIIIVHAHLLGQVNTERWKILDNFIFLVDVTGKQLVKDFGNQSCQCDSLQEHQLHIKAESICKCHCSYRKGVDYFVQCRLERQLLILSSSRYSEVKMPTCRSANLVFSESSSWHGILLVVFSRICPLFTTGCMSQGCDLENLDVPKVELTECNRSRSVNRRLIGASWPF